MPRVAWLVGLCAAATAAAEGTENIPFQQQALDEMIQRMNVVSGDHGGTDFDEALASKHDHNPHRHNPHDHNPHDHNPHDHSPHDHTPHFHCDAGKYNDSDECKACPAGKYSSDGADSCTLCAAGRYYILDWSKKECEWSCPKGKFSVAGSSACTGCPAGTYGSTIKLTSSACTGECPEGKYSAGSSRLCTNCDAGTYGPDIAHERSFCKGHCPMGKYAVEGSTSCSSCAAGKWGAVDALTSSSCSGTCPGGKYSLSMYSACTVCAVGKFSGREASACTSCPKGKYQAYVGRNICTSCEIGKAIDRIGTTSCEVCNALADKYQDTTGARLCKTCISGKFAYLDSVDAPSTSGTACADDCPARLHGFSLGDILISSDGRMQTSMTEGGDTTAQQLMRLKEILKNADVDGDGMLSREEMRGGIASHEVALASEMATDGPLWCNPLRTTCYDDTDEISEALIYADAKLAIDLLGNYQVSFGLSTHFSFASTTGVGDIPASYVSEDFFDWSGSKVTVLANGADNEYNVDLSGSLTMTTGSHIAVQMKCEMDPDTVKTTSMESVTLGVNGLTPWQLGGVDSAGSTEPVSKGEDGWDSYNIPLGLSTDIRGSTVSNVQIAVTAASNSKDAPGLGSYTFSSASSRSSWSSAAGLFMDVGSEKFEDGISALFWTYRHDVDETDGVVFQQGDIKALYRSDKFVLQTPWGEAHASTGSNNDRLQWIHWGVSYDVNNGRGSIFRFGVEAATIEKVSDMSSTVEAGADATVTDDFSANVPGYEHDLCRCPSETPCFNLKNFRCQSFGFSAKSYLKEAKDHEFRLADIDKLKMLPVPIPGAFAERLSHITTVNAVSIDGGPSACPAVRLPDSPDSFILSSVDMKAGKIKMVEVKLTAAKDDAVQVTAVASKFDRYMSCKNVVKNWMHGEARRGLYEVLGFSVTLPTVPFRLGGDKTFVTREPVTIPNTHVSSLSDITVVNANGMDGNYISDDSPLTCNPVPMRSPGQFIFATHDGRHAKMVRIDLSLKGSEVQARAVSAKYADFISCESLYTQFTSTSSKGGAISTTVATSKEANGYGVFGLSIGLPSVFVKKAATSTFHSTTCSSESINCETAREDRSRKLYISNSAPELQARPRSHCTGEGMYLLPVHVIETAVEDTDHICQYPTKTCDDCSLVPGDHCMALDHELELARPNCHRSSEYVVKGPQPFAGRIADVRIYTTALDCHSPMVQNFWEAPLPASSLLEWFRFSTEDGGARFLTSDGGRVLETFLHTPKGLVFTGGIKSKQYENFRPITEGTWTSIPFKNPLRCSFRNLIFFQDPFTAISATSPSSAYDDQMCTDGLNSAKLDYTWASDIQTSINTQCVYLNGMLFEKGGVAHSASVSHSFEQRQANYTIGTSIWSHRKEIYLSKILPAGSCPDSCESDSPDCHGVVSGQTFSVSVISNRIMVQQTSSTDGWTNAINITCKVPGARQSFCVKASSLSKDMGFKCATALFYDGTPLDLNPALSRQGVEFGFTDTTVGETGFEFVRGDSVFSLENAVIVSKVPYNMPHCGRTFGSIDLVDQQASSHPGMLYAYGVRAMNETWSSNIKSAMYRVPWAADFEIQVTTNNDVGVMNILVQVCHKEDPAVEAVGVCWEGLTDKFGIFGLEVSVSKEDWKEEVRHFTIRPVPRPLDSSCDELASLKSLLLARKVSAAATFDGSCGVGGIECSQFEPPSSLVRSRHMSPMTRTFMDQTSLTVWGKVIIAPTHVGGAECSVGGAKVSVFKSGGQMEFKTDDLGQFSFSCTRNEVATVSVAHELHTFAVTKQVVVMGSKDVSIQFHDTTMNKLSLDVVDELRSMHLMSEDLVFRLTSPQCTAPGFVLDIPNRLVDRELPALQYDITIIEGPTLDYAALIAATPNTHCSNSMHFQIVEFFESMGNMKRSVDIRHEADSMEWVFRTGLCLYSTDFDSLPTDNTDTCEVVDNDFVYAEEGQTIDMQVQLFEFFPTGVVHGLRTGVGGTVTLSEEVSGDDSECNPRNGISPNCIQKVTAGEECEDFGCVANITIMAGPPSLLSAVNNFLRLMEIVVVRNVYDFGCPDDSGCTPAETFSELDSVTITRWVPVIGEYSVTDVSKSVTVSTGQSMVFNVLHDPPGGASTASWDESSTMGFAISVDGSSSRNNKNQWTHTVSGGTQFTKNFVLAPMGVGITQGVIAGGRQLAHSWTNTWNTPMTDNVYMSQRGWDVGFRLGKAVTTSTASGNAGRASDLILGGGLELLFSEVIKVYLNTTTEYVCILSIKTTVWEPAKLTTFLYSLEEIYDQMDRARVQSAALKVMAQSDLTGTGTNVTLLEEQAEYVKGKYDDWVDIVDTYERSHNHAELVAQQQARRDEMSAVYRNISDGVVSTDELYEKQAKLVKGSSEDYSGEEIREQVNAVQQKMLSEYHQLKALCVDNDAMPDAETMSSDAGNAGLTALAKECNHLGNHPGRILANVFSHKRSFTREGVPGTPLISGEQGELDALNGHTDSERPSYISFSGGGGALTVSYVMNNDAHFILGADQNDEWSRDQSWTVGGKLKVVSISAEYGGTHNSIEAESASEGGNRGQQKGYATKIAWNLADPDARDKFIVAVHDNLVFGTPVFRIIGGQSRCPAEPNTIHREEGAQILSIDPICEGETEAEKDCLQVHDGEFASYRVKLLVNYQDCLFTDNTGSCVKQQSDLSYNFVLTMTNIYDCSGDDCGEGSSEPILNSVPTSQDYPTCDGASGANGDLIVMVDGVIMGKEFIRFPRVPIGQSEFLLQVGRAGECYNYRDISISLQSECEFFLYNSMCIMTPPDLEDPSAEGFWQSGNTGLFAESKDWCSSKISSDYVFQAAWETPVQQASREASEAQEKLAAQKEEHNELKYTSTSDSADAGLDLMAQSSSDSLIKAMAMGGAALMGMVVVQIGMLFSVMRKRSAPAQSPEATPIRQYL